MVFTCFIGIQNNGTGEFDNTLAVLVIRDLFALENPPWWITRHFLLGSAGSESRFRDLLRLRATRRVTPSK
jgi:hypothetical protein